MFTVSFIICCFNGSDRLDRVLRSIVRCNRGVRNSYEVVIVDNASDEDIGGTARRIWAEIGPHNSLQIIREEKPGQTYARLTGIAAARGRIITFIDNDNYVCSEWVDRLAGAFDANAELGAIGAVGMPEEGMPHWFSFVARVFAVGEFSVEEQRRESFTPYGAGLSVRADILRRILNSGIVFQFSGHCKSSLQGGDDSEFCYYIKALDYKITQDDRLRFVHGFDKQRLSFSSLWTIGRRAGELTANIDGMFWPDRSGNAREEPEPERPVDHARRALVTGLRVFRRVVRIGVRTVQSRSAHVFVFEAAVLWGYVRSHLATDTMTPAAGCRRNGTVLALGAYSDKNERGGAGTPNSLGFDAGSQGLVTIYNR